MRKFDPIGSLMRAVLALYRWTISPLLGHACRHGPSCSAYASEAIERHGSWRGFWLAAARLSRCHPWGSHGFDPVPRDLPERYGILSAWKYGRWSARRVVEDAEQYDRTALSVSAHFEKAE